MMTNYITIEELAGFIAEMLCDALLRIAKCTINVHEYGSVYDFSGIDIAYTRRHISEYCDVKGSLLYSSTCSIQSKHNFFNNKHHHFFALCFKCSSKVYFVNSNALWTKILKTRRSKKADNGKRYYVVSEDDVLKLQKNVEYWTLNIVDNKRNRLTFEKFANMHFDMKKECNVLNSFKEYHYIIEMNGIRYIKKMTIKQQQAKYINHHIRGICMKIVNDDVPE